MRIRAISTATVVLIGVLLLAGSPVHARGRGEPLHRGKPWRQPPGPTVPPDEPVKGPRYLRAEAVEIPDETIRGWANAKCGDEIVLPWFDGEELPAVVESVERTGEYEVVSGKVAADVIGGLVLTIGKETLIGAVMRDTETYHLRPFADGGYSLVQVNADRFMPGPSDGIQVGRVPKNRRPPPLIQRNNQRNNQVLIERLPAPGLVQILGFQLERAPFTPLQVLSPYIDVLVAYTSQAKDWADAEGPNLEAEILTMVGKANLGLAASQIPHRLRLVGTYDVGHQPIYEPGLQTDLDVFRTRFGIYADLHRRRDELGADLVSLLVLNGSEGCSADDGVDRACGVGYVPARFPGPTEVPGTSDWNDDIASLGFSVVDVSAAWVGHAFQHEVGHNLGAQHDRWTHVVTDGGSSPPADPFAFGWIIFAGLEDIDDDIIRNGRTVMAYHDVCELSGFECPLLPVFSNPLQSYFGVRRGDPPPGAAPLIFGPANNRDAINNMAPTVKLYRLVPVPP